MTSRFEMVIDSKPYKVNIHFNSAATENMGDKIMRLIRNEVESAATIGELLCEQLQGGENEIWQ